MDMVDTYSETFFKTVVTSQKRSEPRLFSPLKNLPETGNISQNEINVYAFYATYLLVYVVFIRLSFLPEKKIKQQKRCGGGEKS